MLLASARGRFDFRKADVRSNNWWRRLFITLRELYGEILQEQLREQRQEMLLRFLFSADATQRQNLHDLLQRTSRQQDQLRFPWEKHDEQSRMNGVAEQAKDAWVATWGDTNDPAVAAKIDATTDAILQRARKSRHG